MAKSDKEQFSKYFKNQDYSKIKEECLKKKKLFEDPHFQPKVALRDAKYSGVVWKRPTEISDSPKLLSGRLNSSSVAQGQLGNCWFVAACCSLAQEPDLWKTVVPNHDAQEFSKDKHSGVFQFRFWRFGRWVTVVIDDRLPTINGHLILAHSKNNNEFWFPLLEKAYAKLFGCYDVLDGGNLIDALVDFTGGYGERFDLEEEKVKTNEEKRNNLFEHLKNEKKHHTLMCSALAVPSGSKMESETPLGLIRGHAYCITDVRAVDIKKTGLFAVFKGREKLNMIRLRNPWGEVEWKGPFSDNSVEWKKITKQDREKCGLTFDEDGEFWMTFEDFCINFSTASACHLVNTSWFSFSQAWNEAMFFGQWIKGSTGTATDRAGGCSNYKDTFLKNPQYLLDVKTESDKLMIMLQQPDKREQSNKANNKLNSIGFQVYKVEINRRYRVHHVLDSNVGSSSFMDTRNIFKTVDLVRGRYIVLPTTFEPGKVGNFLLRMFTKHNVNFRELTVEAPKQPALSIFSKYRFATLIRVREGRSLGHEDGSFYFEISCEGKTAKGWPVGSGPNPKWNQSAIFYQKSKKSKIKIKVFNQKSLIHSLVGEATVESPKGEKATGIRVPLKGKEMHGDLYLEVCKSNNIKKF